MLWLQIIYFNEQLQILKGTLLGNVIVVKRDRSDVGNLLRWDRTS